MDASMRLSWLVPDEGSASSLAVRNALVKGEIVWVPGYWRLEVYNSLWMAERRKRLDASGIA
jgi:predicted nucleic acid-binding protein